MKFTNEALRRSMLLYAITDRSWMKEGQTLEELCTKILDNGATFLQLREKDLSPSETIAQGQILCQLCRQRNVPFVVNDSVEIALACDADGVHVGQSDIHGRDIRAMIGPDRILGISAGTVQEATAAQQAGADYIGVGAVFGTSTKKNARNLSVSALREIVEAVSIPVVAIGGINGENISRLAGSRIDGVAIISAIFGAPDPGAATARLLKLADEVVNGHE